MSREAYDYLRLYWSYVQNRCARDFLYLADKWLRIVSKETIGFPTLRLRRIQRLIYETIQQQLREEGYIRLIIHKPRQVGASTLVRGLIFQQVAFRPYREAMLVNHDEPSAETLFKKDHTFYGALPPELQPVLSHQSADHLGFAELHSHSYAQHARNAHVGAGGTVHLVHLTEAARFEQMDAIESSLFPALSTAKGEDFSASIIESTSVYGGDWFREKGEAARLGKSEYRFVSYPWFLHEPYTAPVEEGFELDAEEQELQRRFQLSLEQLQWRRNKIRDDYQSNPVLFRQDYPNTWEESWVELKGTLRVFEELHLKKIAPVITPGETCSISGRGLERSIGGPVTVWEYPKPQVFYHIGVDIALGKTHDADYTTMCVVRRDTLAQVAEVQIHMDPLLDEFLDLVYWLGMTYNRAQLNLDVTGIGATFLTALQKRNYTNIWTWRRRDDAKGRVSTRLGFLFSPSEKRYLVNKALSHVLNGTCLIRSEALLDEMRHYLYLGQDAWGAGSGYKDDLVTAWMLGLLAASDERVEVPPPPPPPPPPPEEWEYHNAEAELLNDAYVTPKMKPWHVGV